MLYAYRWEGDNSVSFVEAESKDDAVFKLDELGAADKARLIPVKDFLGTFQLTDEAEYELEAWGEDTLSALMDQVYPELGEAYAAAPDPNCELSDEVLAATIERIRTTR